jgi:hypothetical protein
MLHPKHVCWATLATLAICSPSFAQGHSQLRPEADSGAEVDANADRIVALFKQVESGLQLTQTGVCHSDRRERRLREADDRVASLRKRFVQRTGRHWDYDLWLVEGTGCEGARHFEANIATIDREIRELKALVE